jgi:hypothetical protein
VSGVSSNDLAMHLAAIAGLLDADNDTDLDLLGQTAS